VGRPANGDDVELPILCAAAPARLRTVPGYRVAQRQVQSPPENLAGLAAANSKDPDLAAWVCAAGARGRWSPSLPKDCDHAVALNPKSTETLLDRGFLKLAIGKNPAADADFRKATTMDPQNAAALFGHSLIVALGGNPAGSRKDRDRALDLDPKVADWVAGTYRIQIGDQYMRR
jgi:Flp pilus assembly protein TadD